MKTQQVGQYLINRCFSKKQIKSKKQARQIAILQTKRSNYIQTFKAYRCNICNCYHIGHSKHNHNWSR